MRRLLLIAFVVGFCPPARAETTNPDFELCGEAATQPITRIRACTNVVESGLQPPSLVARALYNRGRAYSNLVGHEPLARAWKTRYVMPDDLAELAYAKDYKRSLDAEWIVRCRLFASGTRVTLCHREVPPFDPDAFARRDYDQATRIDEALIGPYLNRAIIYISARKLDDALVELDRARQASPASLELLHARAYVTYGLHRYYESKSELDSFIAVAPNFGIGYAMRALVLLKLHDVDAAASDADRAVKVEPQNATIALRRAAIRGTIDHLKLPHGDKSFEIAALRGQLEAKRLRLQYLEEARKMGRTEIPLPTDNPIALPPPRRAGNLSLVR